MIRIENNTDCCGCTACASICGHNAIAMQPDTLGFLYPMVDIEKCVECGLCEKKCAFVKHKKNGVDVTSLKSFYALKHTDREVLKRSQSGGAFVAISDWILSCNGIIYGVTFSELFKVIHNRATDVEGRNSFCSSKYVQSDIRGIYSQVKADLLNNKIVLFTGTPCQVAGLKSYLGKIKQDNLYTVDLICHGVGSPKVWSDFIKYIEEKERIIVSKCSFRNKKEFGWRSAISSFSNGGKTIYSSLDLYYNNFVLRDSCGVCPYTSIERVGDITIGDFWGIERVSHDNFQPLEEGVSLVITSTQKGEFIISNIKDSVILEKKILDECMQPQLQHPTSLSLENEIFKKRYVDGGLLYAMKKMGLLNFRKRISYMKLNLKMLLKNKLK